MYNRLTLSHGVVGWAPLRALTVHGLLPRGGYCHRLSHLVWQVRLNFRGNPLLSCLALRWLVDRGGKWLSVIGGLRLMFRTAERWWTGLWVRSGYGEIIHGADGEWRSISRQSTLHEGGEFRSRTIFGWQHSARGVQASVIESAEHVIRVAGEFREGQKQSGMVLEANALPAPAEGGGISGRQGDPRGHHRKKKHWVKIETKTEDKHTEVTVFGQLFCPISWR